MSGTGRPTHEDMRLFSTPSARPEFPPRAWEQLTHNVDGDTAIPNHRATPVAPYCPAVHNVDSSFDHHRTAEYAPAKRRTVNQKPEEKDLEEEQESATTTRTPTSRALTYPRPKMVEEWGPPQPSLAYLWPPFARSVPPQPKALRR